MSAEAHHEAAVDDLLCRRLVACTLCGARPITYAGVWEVLDGLAFSFAFCRRCEQVMAESEERLDRLLTERYGAMKGGTDVERGV
jgi:hypothetical protein